MASLSFVLRTENLNGRMRETLMAPDGAVRSDVQRRARNVRDQARAYARQRSHASTGRLPASIRYTTAVARGVDTVMSQVGSDLEHAEWTERGTGIYGPHRHPIVPVRARRLRFRSRTTGRTVLAKSVVGQPGKHYLRDALPAFRL